MISNRALAATTAFIFLFLIAHITRTRTLNHIEKELSLLYNNKNPHSKGANPYDAAVTEARLAKYYPYDEERSIPKTLFQMHHKDFNDPEFPDKNNYNRWSDINKDYEHVLSRNDKLIELLKAEFKDTVPEIAVTLDLLPSVILKSDFSRYLQVFLNGGAYADLDTYAREPMDDWFDGRRDVSFVCGMEEDRVGGWDPEASVRIQLNIWFFKSKKFHPILRKLISTVVQTTFEARRKDKLRAYFVGFNVNRCTSTSILAWTGPEMFTKVLFSYFNSLKNPKVIDANPVRTVPNDNLVGPDDVPGSPFDWKFFTGLDGVLMVNDIVVYPLRSLRSPDGECSPDCYLIHKYSGSWKSG